MAVIAPGLSPNLRGALWMLLSAASFSAMTTMIKFLGADYSAALQTFYRQAAGVVVLLPVILKHRSAAFATTRPMILVLRAGGVTVALTLSFYAFQKMPLADANALSFTRTLWLVPLAALVVREPVGPLRISAVVIGFIGVLVMLRPGLGGEFSVGWPALAMLGSALLLALTVTGMKVLTRDHAPMVILVWSAVLGLLFAIPGALLSWRIPEPKDFLLLCLLGVIATFNQACYIKGMQLGDAAAMAPIDYTRLVFTAAAGFLLFGEVPGLWGLVGAGIVVAATLLITLREQQLARSAKLSATADAH